MGNILVAPDVEIADHSNCSGVAYKIQRVDIDSKPITLIFNKENNILYEYIYNDKDRA
jgi:hypothetical protein